MPTIGEYEGPKLVFVDDSESLETFSFRKNVQKINRDFASMLLLLDLLGVFAVFIDEYAVNNHTTHQYTWVERGKGAFIVKGDRKKSITVTAAVSKAGLLHIQVNEDSNNAEAFVTFMEELV